MAEYKPVPGLKEALVKDKCKGLFFRCYKNSHFTNGTISSKIELRFLKRMSCKGCSSCDWMDEFISEDIIGSECCGDNYLCDSQLKSGRIYKAVPHGSSWLSDCGMEYECEIRFEEVKENK